MRVVIRNLQRTVGISSPSLQRLIRRICNFLKLNKGYLSFVFVDNEIIKELNKRYLNKNVPTDVLAFDLTEGPPREDLFGEIIISVEKAKENSRIFSTDLQEELALYIIHGLLHLLGFKDKTPLQKKKMRKKEKELLDYLYTRNEKFLYSLSR